MRDADPSYNADRALWAEVLLRAVDDALQGPEGIAYRDTRLHIIEQARIYLTRRSHDLSLVCTCAGMDMDAVIARMKRLIAEAPTPEELVSTRKATRASLSRRAEKAPRQKRGPDTYSLNGETLTLAQWSERTGVKVETIRARIVKGWDVTDAITLTTTQAQHRARQTMQQRITAEVRGRTWKRGNPETMLHHNGQNLTVKQWSEITGLKVNTIKSRIAKGWSVADTLEPTDRRMKTTTTEERQAA